MNDELAFLSAIAAAPPDDYLPRLVYADWLEERGGDGAAARAAIIRRQLDPSRGEPRMNAAEADPEAVLGWQTLMLAGFRNFHYFDRGMPDVVFCHALDFINDG